MREVHKNIFSLIFQTFVSYNILKTRGKNIFEYTIMYTWIDMTFLRPRFATRDKFLIPNSGNQYKTLLYQYKTLLYQYKTLLYQYKTLLYQYKTLLYQYKTLLYRIQSNGTQYIYNIYTDRTSILGVAHFNTKHNLFPHIITSRAPRTHTTRYAALHHAHTPHHIPTNALLYTITH
jgi:hypothetical protein